MRLMPKTDIGCFFAIFLLKGVEKGLKNKNPLKISGFYAQKVEMEGVEPSSKQGTPMVSTCLFRCWFSCRARERTP